MSEKREIDFTYFWYFAAAAVVAALGLIAQRLTQIAAILDKLVKP